MIPIELNPALLPRTFQRAVAVAVPAIQTLAATVEAPSLVLVLRFAVPNFAHLYIRQTLELSPASNMTG